MVRHHRNEQPEIAQRLRVFIPAEFPGESRARRVASGLCGLKRMEPRTVAIPRRVREYREAEQSRARRFRTETRWTRPDILALRALGIPGRRLRGLRRVGAPGVPVFVPGSS